MHDIENYIAIIYITTILHFTNNNSNDTYLQGYLQDSPESTRCLLDWSRHAVKHC